MRYFRRAVLGPATLFLYYFTLFLPYFYTIFAIFYPFGGKCPICSTHWSNPAMSFFRLFLPIFAVFHCFCRLFAICGYAAA